MTYPTHPSYDDLEEGCIKFANSIADKHIGVVVGLLRGGMFNAVALSHLLGDAPVVALDYSSQTGAGDNIGSHSNDIPHIKQHHVLLVDDIADTGHTISEVDYILRQRGHEVTTYVSYWKEDSAITPDGYQFKIPSDSPWIIFPWE